MGYCRKKKIILLRITKWLCFYSCNAQENLLIVQGITIFIENSLMYSITAEA